jgi:maltose/maltodextrin transport system permease protein
MAMIEKKNYTLRHIILIICVVVILFPLVWLISTSIRRDNAAFSPKLFSNRLTVNNYKDLILQTPNVPELINELNSLSSYIGEYSGLSTSEAQSKATKYITSMEEYFAETQNNFEDLESSYDEIFSLYETQYKDQFYNDINKIRNEDYQTFQEELTTILNLSQSMGINLDTTQLQTMISEYFTQRKEIMTNLESSSLNKDSEYYIETMNTILQIPLKTSAWRVRTYRRWVNEEPEAERFEESILSLSERWDSIETEIEKVQEDIQLQANELYGQSISQVSQLETELNNINSQISQITSQQALLERQNSEIFNSLSALFDIFIVEKERLHASYNILRGQDLTNVEGKSPLFGEDKSFYENVQKFSQILPLALEDLNSIDIFIENGFVETLELLTEVYQFLNENFTKIYAIKDSKSILPSYQAAKSSTLKLSGSIDELLPLTSQYSSNTRQLAQYSTQLNTLREQKNEIQITLSQIQQENEEILTNLEKIQNLPFLLVYMESTNQEISNNFESTNYASFVSSKYYPYFTPDRNRYVLMNWYNNLLESKQRFDQGREKLTVIQNQMEENINIFKTNLTEYLTLNQGGNVTTIEPLSEIQTLYNTQYGKASADIARASRIVSDLANYTDYSELKSKLRNIDKNLYFLQEDWSAKVRKPFMRWLLNSIMVAGITSVLTVLITSVAAYPFSRMRFVGRKQGLFFLMIIQMFPGVMFMIAIYGILKFMGDNFGVFGLDSLDGLIFAYMGGIAYNMWLFKGYYDTIPDSLEESAMIDGATRFQTFWRIVLPLSLPIIAVVMILTFMNIFNEFVMARIILQSEANYTYAVGLQTFSTGPYETEWGLFTAASLLGAVPMIILFLSLQRWIIGGLTQGSVKG